MDNLQRMRTALQKRWLHSHEEDTDAVMVYRPASYPFPRSRGRMGFELRPDNSLTEIGTAPGDGPREESGTWKIRDGEPPELMLEPASSASRVLRISAVDEGRLEIEPQV